MNKLLKYKLSSILVLIGLISSINVFSMEEPIEKTIKVKTNDGQIIELTEDIWKLSPVIKSIVETPMFEKKGLITFNLVDSKNMNLILEVIQEVESKVNKHLPFDVVITPDLLKKFPGTIRAIVQNKISDVLKFKRVADFLGIDFIVSALDREDLSIADLIIENKVPDMIRGDNVILSLLNLGITDLFGLKYIKNINEIEILFISGGNITNIPAGSFQDLNNLLVLKLQGNNIRSISMGAFQGLNNLTGLDLSFNSLTNIPSGLFQNLNKLFVLSFGSNQIKNIPVGAFQGLGNLANLHLNNNQIVEIPVGAFQGLNNLWKLNLTGNPLSANFISNMQNNLPQIQVIF